MSSPTESTAEIAKIAVISRDSDGWKASYAKHRTRLLVRLNERELTDAEARAVADEAERCADSEMAMVARKPRW